MSRFIARGSIGAILLTGALATVSIGASVPSFIVGVDAWKKARAKVPGANKSLPFLIFLGLVLVAFGLMMGIMFIDNIGIKTGKFALINYRK